jgi:hypothetical protein
MERWEQLEVKDLKEIRGGYDVNEWNAISNTPAGQGASEVIFRSNAPAGAVDTVVNQIFQGMTNAGMIS